MIKFKKLATFCMALSLTVSLSLVASCGGSSKTTSFSSSSSSSSTEDEEPATEAEKYTVTVTKPVNVTIAGTLTADEGEDVTFTATVDSSYVLTATGATQVGEPTTADELTTYTYKVSAIQANTAVTISATQIHLSGNFNETNCSVTIPANGSYTATLPNTNTTVQNYCVTWDNDNESIKVFVNGQELANDCSTAVTSDSSIVALNTSNEEITCAFRIVPYVDEIGVMAVGTNEYTINLNADTGYIIVDFAVTAGKTYSFTVTNGSIKTLTASYPEDTISSYKATSTDTVQFAVRRDINGPDNVAVTVVVTETHSRTNRKMNEELLIRQTKNGATAPFLFVHFLLVLH